jgi:hypothetical protein
MMLFRLAHRFLITALGVAALSGAAQAQGVSFTLNNRSGQPLRELYVTPAGDANWGQNRLPSGPVMAGQSTVMHLRDTTCIYDLRAVYGNSSREERREVNLCHGADVVLNGTGNAAGKAADDPSFRLTNRLKQPIVELNATPVGQPRGANLLAAAPLAPEASIPLHPVRGKGCRFELRVVSADKVEKTRTLDLCKATELSIP